MSDTFLFADETSAPPPVDETWRLFIVDDDRDIHEITKLALKGLQFKGKSISFESAYSAAEAIDYLKTDPNFAIVLLDIGMEEKDSGLDVASFIRQEQYDDVTRIIIRTGQPGDVPEREIIDHYDINDYKSKTELTVERLFTSIRTAIAQYDQINELVALNRELEDRVEKAVHIQKKQQEILFSQTQSAQMNEMLSMIAHQWRQPLARISAVTAQVQLSSALGELNTEEISTQVEHIQEYTTDLSDTIEEFRNVYKPNSPDEKIQLFDLLQKCSSIISNSYKDQKIRISINCDKACHQTVCSNEVYQVVLNILKNAQEAFLECKTEAEIHIDVKRDEEKTEIFIQDNAGGIEEELLQKVFDPYFSTKENRNGHGLGLYMSKNIIEQHCGGQLTLTSSNDTSCFTITLPNK